MDNLNSSAKTTSLEITESDKKSSTKDVKTSEHAIRYFFVGVTLTIINYLLYTVLSNFIITNLDLLWLSSLISVTITSFIAYFLHTHITWKERKVSKTSIYKFFIWNALLAFAISPAFTQLFSLFTPLYELGYNISSTIHLPFNYDFILTTGAFVLTTITTMILNFLFYDRFVFGKTR